ncbi:hypothetical protein HBI56_156690 [Parastagonospora nodorum]|nr:hypothetical protein HBH53_070100 [Parastagonospora nodorum]KAH3973866.1 hypothetical protein HBH52_141720 [Parastagonospora nodorum]KAH3998781.1 hypothetical protein HBI10_128670 [Parastagonospora nodorum]KAH4023927.1 hypothetical protein HBI13_080880 [Parastagonospora nodorum]KAH4033651.1 hypothetical protein HBI09_111190 [Parastagonospora nodorum]
MKRRRTLRNAKTRGYRNLKFECDRKVVAPNIRRVLCAIARTSFGKRKCTLVR